MKKIFSKSNTIIIIVCLLFLLLILKGGIGIVYQYGLNYAKIPEGMHTIAPVISSAKAILIDNLIITICFIILCCILNKNKKIVVIVIIFALLFFPFKANINKWDMKSDNSLYINIHRDESENVLKILFDKIKSE